MILYKAFDPLRIPALRYAPWFFQHFSTLISYKILAYSLVQQKKSSSFHMSWIKFAALQSTFLQI